MTDSKHQLGTLALHAGHTPDEASLSRAVPIYATSSYVFKNSEHAANLFALKELGNIYSRLMNPTTGVLEERLSALDGGMGGLCFASGMAAINAAILTIAHAGHNIISSKNLYGGTMTLFTHTFKNLGVETRFFNSDQPSEIGKLIDARTRCVYLETIGNPKNDVPDLEAIVKIAHEHGIPVIVDNTVMTAVGFKPLEHGADIVVYSTTKFIGGHGVHIGGAVIDSGRFAWDKNPDKWPEFCSPDPSYHGPVFAEVAKVVGIGAYVLHMRTHWLRDTGACMSPFAAQQFLLGVETLHLRMPRHFDNAMQVARWLESHPAVKSVSFSGLETSPWHSLAKKYFKNGFGAIVGFEIKGGREAGIKCINHVRLASHLANIGDAKTLIIHPASTTHQQLTEAEQLGAGVTPAYIRISVGLEDICDIKADLDQALKKSQG